MRRGRVGGEKFQDHRGQASSAVDCAEVATDRGGTPYKNPKTGNVTYGTITKPCSCSEVQVSRRPFPGKLQREGCLDIIFSTYHSSKYVAFMSIFPVGGFLPSVIVASNLF